VFVQFMPRINKVVETQVRIDQTMLGLQTIEAIRMYAARNDGRLPGSLDELSAVAPLPKDPVSGLPFVYRLERERAILEWAPIRPESAQRGVRYEITIQSN
jgi:hypothetical protein